MKTIPNLGIKQTIMKPKNYLNNKSQTMMSRENQDDATYRRKESIRRIKKMIEWEKHLER